MNSDSYYTIGSGHEFCQDYSIHGKLSEGVVYAMGADGCSDSPKSDLGARLICESARRILEVNNGSVWAIDAFKAQLLQQMRELRTMLRLDQRNLDATFWVTVMGVTGYWIAGWGDGVVVKKFDDGSTEIDKIEYTAGGKFVSGAPRYLSYGLDPDRYKAYLAETKGATVVHETFYSGKSANKDTLKVEDFSFYEEGEIQGGGRAIKSISVLSDGANTFKDKTAMEFIPVQNAASDVTDFVNYKGRFVERQLKWLAKRYAKQEISHYDDLFCATVLHESCELTSEELAKALL